MTNISKSPLSSAQQKKLFTQLSICISTLNKEKTDTFLSDLLGYEERIMIAKRLAAIIMLIQGQSLYRVAITLHISPATAQTFALRLEAGEFTSITKLLKQDKHTFVNLLNALDSILHLGGLLPHYNGLDRYNGV
ncbi:MAG: hypothetical protein AUK16_03085 [Parcubacteria group bacterium CG2_30_44_11]|nr:MAG: hypothetical protein AUK16_03085 [Parcubacteria group bacterium CG2_30_44_11]